MSHNTTIEEACRIILGNKIAAAIINDQGVHWAVVAAMLEDAICSFISDPELLRAALASPAVAPVAVPQKPVAWQTRQKPTGAKHWGAWHFGKMTADRDGWDVEERQLGVIEPSKRKSNDQRAD